jgi:hypothetical protein
MASTGIPVEVMEALEHMVVFDTASVTQYAIAAEVFWRSDSELGDLEWWRRMISHSGARDSALQWRSQGEELNFGEEADVERAFQAQFMDIEPSMGYLCGNP